MWVVNSDFGLSILFLVRSEKASWNPLNPGAKLNRTGLKIFAPELHQTEEKIESPR